VPIRSCLGVKKGEKQGIRRKRISKIKKERELKLEKAWQRCESSFGQAHSPKKRYRSSNSFNQNERGGKIASDQAIPERPATSTGRENPSVIRNRGRRDPKVGVERGSVAIARDARHLGVAGSSTERPSLLREGIQLALEGWSIRKPCGFKAAGQASRLKLKPDVDQ